MNDRADLLEHVTGGMHFKNPEYRVLEGKVFGGVCAGIAHRKGKSPERTRWLYAIAQMLTLPMALVYVIQWATLPVLDDPAHTGVDEPENSDAGVSPPATT